uniref:Uncharacterized protein n=1 Tax=uncultured Desulfobacterium sp. TaxID=201089 RepID=E1YDU6_9BACT|nr:unknown protein [uncultured Desulfobacterium sp.]
MKAVKAHLTQNNLQIAYRLTEKLMDFLQDNLYKCANKIYFTVTNFKS